MMYCSRNFVLIIFAVFMTTPFALISRAEDLLDIYDLAKINDLSIQKSTISRQAELENLKQSKSLYYPSVNIIADVTRGNNNVERTDFEYSYRYQASGYYLTLRQPLYHYDTFIKYKQAKVQASRADTLFEEAQQAFIFRVAKTYFSVLIAKSTLEFVNKEKQAIIRQLANVQQLRKKRQSTITDVTEAQARLDLITSQQVNTKRDLSVALESLRQMTGDFDGALDNLKSTAPILEPIPKNVASWVSSALNHSFDVKKAELAVDLAISHIKLQSTQNYPTVDFVGHYYFYDGLEDIEFSGAKTNHSSAMVQLNWNIYQGGMIQSLVTQARLHSQITKITLKQIKRTIKHKTRDAYNAVITRIERVKELKQVVRSQQQALKLTKKDVKRGARTTINVLNARTDLFNVQRELMQARINYIIDSLRLSRISGALTIENLKSINGWLIVHSL